MMNAALALSRSSTSPPYPLIILLTLHRGVINAYFSTIFPFISEQLASHGVPLAQTGTIAGIAEGISMLTESIAAGLMGRAISLKESGGLGWSMRRLLLWTMGLQCIAGLAYAYLANGVASILLVRMLLGFSSGNAVLARLILMQACGAPDMVKVFVLGGFGRTLGAVGYGALFSFSAGGVMGSFPRMVFWLIVVGGRVFFCHRFATPPLELDEGREVLKNKEQGYELLAAADEEEEREIVSGDDRGVMIVRRDVA